MNLHIKAEGTNEHHKIEGIFKALARALRWPYGATFIILRFLPAKDVYKKKKHGNLQSESMLLCIGYANVKLLLLKLYTQLQPIILA